jgi:hypothetical protein
LMSSFLTLSTSIRLHGLGFGLEEVQIWEQFCQFGLLQFQHRVVLGDGQFGEADSVRLSWFLASMLGTHMYTFLPSFELIGSAVHEQFADCWGWEKLWYLCFVVSYLLWLLLLLLVDNKEKCVVISRDSRETLYQGYSSRRWRRGGEEPGTVEQISRGRGGARESSGVEREMLLLLIKTENTGNKNTVIFSLFCSNW